MVEAPADPCGRDGQMRPGRGHDDRSRVDDLGDDVNAAGQRVGGQLASFAEELDRDNRRRRPVDIGAEGAWSKRVQVAIMCGVSLGEVDMSAVSALVGDAAEELVEADDLMVADGRLDVPVAEDVPACLRPRPPCGRAWR